MWRYPSPALSEANDTDDLVQPPIELLVFRDGGDRGGSFEPFVEVAVIPGRAPVLPFGQARRNQEVVIELARFRAPHDPPHVGDHDVPARRVSIGPETPGPRHVAQADAAHRHMRAGRSVGQPPAGARWFRIVRRRGVLTRRCGEVEQGEPGRERGRLEEEVSAAWDLFAHGGSTEWDERRGQGTPRVVSHVGDSKKSNARCADCRLLLAERPSSTIVRRTVEHPWS